jgi:hypothetical protein
LAVALVVATACLSTPRVGPGCLKAGRDVRNFSHVHFQIWNKVVTTFDAAEALIETDIAKVEAVLPGVAPVVTEIKQAASNAIGVVNQDLVTYEPELVTGLETVLDAALSKYTGGLALPLVQGVNAGVSGISNVATQAVSAWLLSQQAALAENNPTTAAAKTATPAAPQS